MNHCNAQLTMTQHRLQISERRLKDAQVIENDHLLAVEKELLVQKDMFKRYKEEVEIERNSPIKRLSINSINTINK